MSKIKRFFRRKSLLRNIILGILVVVTVGAAVGGIVALTRNTDKIDEALTYKSIGWTKYSIGGLAPSNGAYMSTDKSIYTAKAFECQGLNVTPVFDSNVSYEIYFYDQNNEFVHTTGRLTGTFVQDSVPFFAKYARIVITPNEDNKVTIFEKAKYAKQLGVKVYREQGFKNYTENLLTFTSSTTQRLSLTTGEVTSYESETNPYSFISDYVGFSAYGEGLYYKEGAYSSNSDTLQFYIYDSAKHFVETHNVGYYVGKTFTSSTGVVYHYLEFSAFPENGAYLRMDVFAANNSLQEPELYCR